MAFQYYKNNRKKGNRAERENRTDDACCLSSGWVFITWLSTKPIGGQNWRKLNDWPLSVRRERDETRKKTNGQERARSHQTVRGRRTVSRHQGDVPSSRSSIPSTSFYRTTSSSISHLRPFSLFFTCLITQLLISHQLDWFPSFNPLKKIQFLTKSIDSNEIHPTMAIQSSSNQIK